MKGGDTMRKKARLKLTRSELKRYWKAAIKDAEKKVDKMALKIVARQL